MEKMVTNLMSFWRDKRVLITGHTGFKGGWLALWLQHLGADIAGIALPPLGKPNLFELAIVGKDIQSQICDIRDEERLSQFVVSFKPDIVFNLAAQPLVRKSYSIPSDTFSINTMGTVNILEAIRQTGSVRVAIMITTDKVYKNTENYYPYRECDALGGHDPYSASKAASEIVISSYRDSFFVKQGVALASARAGNVIGGGDWSEDRLIPDAVRSWQGGHMLSIRSPQSVRPWQHVLDPLHSYMELAQKLWMHPELANAFNFGPNTNEVATVRDIIEMARIAYGQGEVEYCNENNGPHEAGWLGLETIKARTQLGIEPVWGLNESVKKTMSWYKLQNEGMCARELCLSQIEDYERDLEAKNV